MMTLPLIVAAIFVVTLGLLLSGLYFFVETPIARRKMRIRLAAVQQVAIRSDETPELLKKELLSDVPALHRILTAIPGVARLRLFLDQAAVRMQVGTFVLIVIAGPLFAVTFGLIFNVPFLFSLLGGLGFGILPFVLAAWRRHQRLAKFEELFPDAIDLLARAVRAGHAFTTGFEMVGAELPDPIGEEFRLVYQQQNLGLPLKDALANMVLRVPLSDVRIFVSAVQIQRESGGNLGEILDTLSSVIRERFKLQRQVRIYTAEGRLSMYALTALPLVTLVGLTLFKADYLKPLVTDPAGRMALAVAAVLQIVGYFVIGRIVRIKI
jgi:tight adherence protein B